MQLTIRKLVVLLLASLLIWLIFTQQDMMTPFLLGAIFAYIFHPLVVLLAKRTKIPKVLSIIIIYGGIIALIGLVTFNLASLVVHEGKQLADSPNNIFKIEIINQLPSYDIVGQTLSLKPIAEETIQTLVEASKTLQKNFLPLFTGAFETFISVIIFLVSAFYFLKDGPKMVESLKKILPLKKEESKELSLQINDSLGGYLRGLLILIAIMSLVTWASLSILGIKFALILAILTGFLEIIPFIGPLTAALLATLTAVLTGTNNFGLDGLALGIVVAIIYFTLRQLEDYFIVPQVIGRATKLHPLLILFSVLVGGRVAGPLGFVLAVPVAAIGRILLEYFLKKG